MTQFQPPPDFAGIETPPVGHPVPSPHGPQPWSASAIAGFVLSLVGCLGVTALAGLILGVVGIVKTSNGRRQGRGLAIAALPISLATGAVFLFVVLMGVRVNELIKRIPVVFTADISDQRTAVTLLRELGSTTFNNEFSAVRLQVWFDAVRTKHGRMVEMDYLSTGTSDAGQATLSFRAKFVKGPARIEAILQLEGLHFCLDDIRVDGVSPRDVK